MKIYKIFMKIDHVDHEKISGQSGLNSSIISLNYFLYDRIKIKNTTIKC